MDEDFWQQRWEAGQIAFHRPSPNELLVAHWDALGAPDDSPVFVPLCGKSVDMVWLAERGHRVVGNELSPIAVHEFFAEHGLTPDRREVGSQAVYEAASYELWCGSFFDLTAEAVAECASVYDRASLVALPPSMRADYAAHLTAILPAGAGILLISFEYRQDEMNGPPFSVTLDEIGQLYGGAFAVDQVASIDGLLTNPELGARGITALRETATILRRR